MCLICVDIERERMTRWDAQRALGEMSSTLEPDHVAEVRRKIEEMPEEKKEQKKAPQQRQGSDER